MISVPAPSGDPRDQIQRLERRLAREREARLMAERIAEKVTRDLFIQKQRLKLVESIASAANLLDDPSDAFRVTLDEICNYTGWATGHVWIFAEDQSETVELISSGVWSSNTGPEAKAFRRVTQAMTFGPGLSLPGRVLEKRQAVWIADIGLDIHFQRARIAQECGLRAAFAFPALIGTEVGAVLEFFQITPRGPDEELMRTVEQIGAQLGRVVERKRNSDREAVDKARLTHMALHDQESGLPNRLWLEREAAIDAGLWVVLLGVDRFEVVRNAIGYDSMAQMMTALGARLVGLADGVAIARIDAGALGLVVEAADEAGALIIAERLCATAEAPIKLSGTTLDVSLTAGVSTCGRQPGGVSSPIDRAAIALDQARAGKKRATLFDAVAYGDPGGNLSLISDLMAGLKTRDVWVAYQPKYDLRAGVINGAEALMRWRHPRRGFVSPDLFIGMAEETGQIRPLTEWVIRRAIKDQRTLAKAGHDVVLSVNISGRLLSDENFAEFALNKVAAANARLCFEITETAVIDNPEVALAIIDRFAAAGIGVSIDDYGSGLSSLAYLKQIRADELKIDKSFIMPLDTSSRDALLVKSTIDLAHSLGLKVTAEGVETATALALLQGMGCDIAQGYFIARPMPIADLMVRLGEPAVPGVVSIGSPGPEAPTPGWVALSGALSG